ncbi:pentapeptide repeat-containing protein [Kriegella aquimaris]|uniref:Uncharacterized protein YjbI, contains pentapeptide repeats n=1 Tax=Kriegella aquimaris TaxID=192904 RepID=A0A1G9XV75_9FLAO|nr:pentapeptide repeat-containing protein [Kriegella aquimaris]SDN00326.1 Uncharacterized protein YjbI, contains pentapeptide repeats [Kriegella aquimaris]
MNSNEAKGNTEDSNGLEQKFKKSEEKNIFLEEKNQILADAIKQNTQVNERIRDLEKSLVKKKKNTWSKAYKVFLDIGTFSTAVIVGVFIFRQTGIMGSQTAIFEKQTKLLESQEGLIRNQNELFRLQNQKFDKQNELFGNQNDLVISQNDLVAIQNEKTEHQNRLVDAQNQLFDYQNKRIDQQTNLQEAERRSSLIFLFNNVLDKIDDELKNTLNASRILSPQLIGRIVSLSQALKPYKYLQNDTIINNAVSPERGQLLLSLINSKINKVSLAEIISKANFKNSEILGGYFKSADLKNINLTNSVLDGSNFVGVNFSGAKLVGASLKNANLNQANFEEANLSFAILKGIKCDYARFIKVNLVNTDFSESKGKSVLFEEVNLKNTKFHNSSLKNCKFKNKWRIRLFYGQEEDYPTSGQGEGFMHYVGTTSDKIPKEGTFNLIVGRARRYNAIEGDNITKLIHKLIFYSSATTINLGATYTWEIENCDFFGADLTDASFENYVFSNSKFQESVLYNISFSNIAIQNTYFDRARINKRSYENNFNANQVPIGPPSSYYKLVYDDVQEKEIIENSKLFKNDEMLNKRFEGIREKYHYLTLIKEYD